MSKKYLGKRSEENTSQCTAFCQAVIRKAIEITHIDFSVICGHRGEIAQNKAYSSGYSKLKFDNSKHNKKPSQAFDIIPFFEDKSQTYKPMHYAVLYGALKAAEIIVKRETPIFNKYSLIGGINWDDDEIVYYDQTFQDLGHYEQQYI